MSSGLREGMRNAAKFKPVEEEVLSKLTEAVFDEMPSTTASLFEVTPAGLGLGGRIYSNILE